MEENKIEEMLSQLIGMVGNMREGLVRVEEGLVRVEEVHKEMKEQNELNYKGIMDKMNTLVIDQDITWEKAARNEREIAKLKKLLEV
ncbi:hypothetical protein IM538_21925 [Cytobacillus suaedae]|nr:hypothetical protein IM538_21925 [Cytobacillus suaedae]